MMLLTTARHAGSTRPSPLVFSEDIVRFYAYGGQPEAAEAFIAASDEKIHPALRRTLAWVSSDLR
jgi:hypothetical protein